ncbi:MAG TPA: hypothetical protein VGL62_05920 [Vicinamibacterales bacterium]|jgi:hypothetical protein
MTEEQSRTAANAVLAVAVLGAGLYVARRPRLRSLAWGFAKLWLAGPAAAWAVALVRESWQSTG